MLPYEIILKKRNGEVLERSALENFIGGYVDGRIPDYQMAAFLMAVYFRGMTPEETATLTDVMVKSGVHLKPACDKPTVDKHSTGGVGDKVSIPLIPLLACCDCAVPMISGRGLGHTGGTLDKIESVPGFRTGLSEQEFLDQVDSTGMALAAQTASLVPADKKMYALRDVTGTVDSIPLISASIMSKKIAEGVNHLLLDVKTGLGAFMKEYDDAISLARSMVAIGRAAGLDMRAVVTDMNQPLGQAVGNAIEINESLALLKGDAPKDFETVTFTTAGHLLHMAGKASTPDHGIDQLKAKVASGEALEKFRELITVQGGDDSFIDTPSGLPLAQKTHVVTAPEDGFITRIEPVKIGYGATLLGGGRLRTDDILDYQVGVSVAVELGNRVTKGQDLAVLYYNERKKLNEGLPYIESAFRLSSEAEEIPELIKNVINP